jgi:hypothetical protein
MAPFDDPHVMRVITVWTARVTLAFFVVGFVLLGRPGATSGQRVACRGAAAVMVVHLVALVVLNRLIGRAPLSFGSLMQWLVSIGGGGAAVVVVLGWFFWNRGWYRYAVYWPWGVFLFTYVILVRHGDTAARIRAAPLLFGPVVAVLLLVLAWRVRADLRAWRS